LSNREAAVQRCPREVEPGVAVDAGDVFRGRGCDVAASDVTPDRLREIVYSGPLADERD
jgi:hypothetical protein